MNKPNWFFIFITFAIIAISTSFLIAITPSQANNSTGDVLISSVLKAKYNLAKQGGPKIKVLIVPGHDPKDGGAEYKQVKERTLNVALADELKNYLINQGVFDVMVARDEKNYNPILQNYFETNKETIQKFVLESPQRYTEMIYDSDFETREGVIHPTATPDVALKLYGINKYVSENNIDLVIHVHFNNYPRRNNRQPGKYKGFTIYVPDRQFDNGPVSQEIAGAILDELNIFWPKSNLPKESEGIIHDQKLIAIGSANTLKQPSVLIEYGYIYESQFKEKKIRDLILKEMAYKTYCGLINFFEDKTVKKNFESTLLSPLATTTLHLNDKNTNVLYLESALLKLGFYPPSSRYSSTTADTAPLKDLNLYRCPLDGVFGKCTTLSLKEFQKSNNLKADGVAGLKTIEKINSLLGF